VKPFQSTHTTVFISHNGTTITTENIKNLNYLDMNVVGVKLEIIEWLVHLEDLAVLQKLIDLKQATEEEVTKENLDA